MIHPLDETKKFCVKTWAKYHMSHKCHKALHSGHHLFHCLYLGAVGIEAHGFYGKAAMVLLVFTLIQIFSGDTEMM